MSLPNIGDRIVVHGIDYAKAYVKNVTWNNDQYRWQIELEWDGGFGSSRVYPDDENKVWFRYANAN